ncbi:MAG: branched-chain amino acid ABC transporter permease [Tepidisphaeraceae bacterium]|jgi:branched-chain amino acid transport system permease protein
MEAVHKKPYGVTMLHPPSIPAWMANTAIVALIAALWPLSAAFDKYLDPYYLDIIIQIGIAIILAVSLNLINGITGQFSLGHAGFMAVGGYAGGVLLKHYDPQGAALPLAFAGLLVLGGIVAAMTGVLVGIPTLRLRGDYLAIATLGFGEIIKVILNQIDSIGSFEVGGSAGLHNIPIVSNFFWVYAWAIICIVVIGRLVHSAKGKPFYAVREDEIAAAAMGVDTTYYKVAAFVIGAFFAGVAGVLSACVNGNLVPKSFDFVRSVEIVMMVVLGGSGSITGSILAAILLTWLPEGLRRIGADQWRMVIYALLLIFMMLLRPEGLLGTRELWPLRRKLQESPEPEASP